MRIAYRSHASALLIAAVDQRRRLANCRAIRTELLAVVSTRNTVLTKTRAERTAVFCITEAGARRTNTRLVTRLERRERYIRLECREISRGAPWLIRGLMGRRLRRCDRLHRLRHLDGVCWLLQKRHELSHL